MIAYTIGLLIEIKFCFNISTFKHNLCLKICCRYFSGVTNFVIVFGIFSFFSFISVSFISPISIPFSIFKSFNDLEILHSIISIFNLSTFFISVFNVYIAFIDFLFLFLNFVFSLMLFGLPENLFFIATKFNFVSNSSNSSFFYYYYCDSFILYIFFFFMFYFSNLSMIFDFSTSPSTILKSIRSSLNFSISIYSIYIFVEKIVI